MKIALVEKILCLNSFDDLYLFLDELEKLKSLNQDYFLIDFRSYLKKNIGIRSFFKNKYSDFIKKHNSLLCELANNGILEEIIISAAYRKKKDVFFEFLSYLHGNCENKQQILNNLEHLRKLGFNSFNYVFDNTKLSGVFNILESNKDVYQISSIYTDGDEFWSIRDDRKCYLLEVKEANFILSYKKNSVAGLTKKDISVVNLHFPTSKLPSYSDLYDLDKWQYIDRENIIKKKDIIDELNTLILSVDKVKNLYLKVDYLIDKLDFSTEEVCFLKQIVEDKQLSKILEDLLPIFIKKSQESGIITEEDMKILERKKL